LCYISLTEYVSVSSTTCIMGPKSCRVRRNSANYTAIDASPPFKVIQGLRFWYQSKAHMRLLVFNIGDWWLIVTYLRSCTVSRLWPIIIY